MTVALADVDAGAQHQSGKGNSGNPGIETEGEEGAKNKEDNTSGVLLAVEVVDGGTKGEDDVEDTGNPDKDLGEETGDPDVEDGEDE